MYQTITQVFIRRVRLQRALFWALFAYSAFLAALYMYFIMSAVVHVVLRQELAGETRDVRTEIGELDAAYLAAHEAITRERADELGLTGLRSVSYVQVSPPTALSYER